MRSFLYQHANDEAEAVHLARNLRNAQFIAGETSQVDLMKEGVQQPVELIDILRIGLDEITRLPDGGHSIGANVRNAGLSDNPTIREGYAGIAEAFGAVFVELRVDSGSGVVRVARLCGVYDYGRIINPRTAHSQLMGGMQSGLGAALIEEWFLDPSSALPVVRDLADYQVPSCVDTPEITIEVLNIPDPHFGAIGAHGVGRWAPTFSTATGNAIYNVTGCLASFAAVYTR